MLEYIKMIIIAFVSGIFSPLAVSSSAHYTFLSSVLSVPDQPEFLGFYSAAVTASVSLVVFIFLRKIYSKSLKSFFSKKAGAGSPAYKSVAKNLLVSLIPALVMFIPTSKDRFVADIFSGFLGKKSILVASFCCLASGLILFLALWYSKQKKTAVKRSTSLSGAFRFAFYQIPSYIFPGLSRFSMGAAAILVDNVDERAAAREVLLYTAPSGFIISLFRMIRFAVSGFSVDPLMLLLCVVFSAGASALMLLAVGKVNIKKLFSFFAVYSIVFGIFMSAASFFID